MIFMRHRMEFRKGSLNDWTDPSFWQKTCPDLSVNGNVFEDEKRSAVEKTNDPRDRLEEQGFFWFDNSMDQTITQKLRKGIETLHSLGYPATFILMFDETWELARQSWAVLRQPDHRFVYDVLAWYVTDQGFSPHRDRQPKESVENTFSNGIADFITHWIAISDATPETSCLYVVPKPHDPGYVLGDDEQDPLQRALPNKQAYGNIRALPCQAGQSVVFTHRLMHWGSARDPASTKPCRMAISFVGAKPSFEKPYLLNITNPEDPWNLTHQQRLLLVCAQLIIYYQRFDLPRHVLKLCYDVCKKHTDELEEEYRRKVFVEFCKAMKEKGGNEPSAEIQKEDNNNDEDDDAEEAVMEEMLNAEAGGYGEFEDDFDDGDAVGAGVDGEADESSDDNDDDDGEFAGMSLFGDKASPDGDDDRKPPAKKKTKHE